MDDLYIIEKRSCQAWMLALKQVAPSANQFDICSICEMVDNIGDMQVLV